VLIDLKPEYIINLIVLIVLNPKYKNTVLTVKFFYVSI